ncbi:MAG: histidine ammonia-lyase [Gemmatimonadetes bacterium]|nr:histidine ammonia-lyase [Gemmatimonadota bacterium]
MTGSSRIDGRSLDLDTVGAVANAGVTALGLDATARARMERSRAVVDAALTRNARVYGISTGFGRLSEVYIGEARRQDLQLNLVRSHASGVGRPLERAEVRAMMVLRANALARGNSGCRPLLVDRLLDFINRGLTPVVPEAGSVGASGDLAPLAHVALALIGEGGVDDGGGPRPAAAVMAEQGLEPLRLLEKEGLALINGTQATTGLGSLAALASRIALESAEAAGAASLEALRGTPAPFHESVHEARPHPGQLASARRLRALLDGSEIRESHRFDDPRIHDAYSLRCMPQVHGAAREVLGYAWRILTTECNASTDNPLVFAEGADGEGSIVSAGNFHAQIVAQALDFMAIALVDLASISERRVERLLNPDLSGLPAFLARDPGVESGFMIAQVAAVDLLSEMRVLAHPASVDSVSTSAAKEDHVSMGMAAARKLRRVVECLEYVLAIELLVAVQALEFHRPLRPGRGVARVVDVVRERVAPLDGDRSLTEDIEQLRTALRSGAFAALWSDFTSHPDPEDSP